MNKSVKHLFTYLLLGFFYCGLSCIAAIFFSLLWHLLILVLYGEKQGVLLLIHQVRVANYELDSLLPEKIMVYLHHQLEQIASIHVFLKKWQEIPISESAILNESFLAHLSMYLKALILALQWILIRSYLWIYDLIYFVVFAIVGISDGLAQRYIRRVSVARESAVIYHHARQIAGLSFLLSLLVIFIFPLSLCDTQGVIFLLVILWAWLLQVSAKMFKKYL